MAGEEAAVASDAGGVAWTKWQCRNSCKANNSGDGENALWSLPPGGGAVESRRRRREAVKGGRESMRRWKAERGEKRRRETVERCDVIIAPFAMAPFNGEAVASQSETAENATSTPRGAEGGGAAL